MTTLPNMRCREHRAAARAQIARIEHLMTPQSFPRIQQIFEQARDLPSGSAREALLDRLCSGDTAMRAEVVSLLAADDTAGAGFLEAPALGAGFQADALADPTAPVPSFRRLPDLVGYRPVRALGSGGQAVVFLALQVSTGRRVAVKVLRDGAWADERQRTRFAREAQLLAALEHPHIVAIVDR